MRLSQLRIWLGCSVCCARSNITSPRRGGCFQSCRSSPYCRRAPVAAWVGAVHPPSARAAPGARRRAAGHREDWRSPGGEGSPAPEAAPAEGRRPVSTALLGAEADRAAGPAPTALTAAAAGRRDPTAEEGHPDQSLSGVGFPGASPAFRSAGSHCDGPGRQADGPAAQRYDLRAAQSRPDEPEGGPTPTC